MTCRIKRCIAMWILAAVAIQASVRESEIEGLVGKTVRLPCEVDEDTCGYLHNIKWYKGNERVYIFSDVKDVSRPEGSLLQRGRYHYANGSSVNWLEISPLLVKDESNYKCEVTYLSVQETCPLVQFVNLTTLARPNSYQLSFEDGTLIDNGTKIGPFLEGDDLVLRCEAGGAKPVPSVKWTNGTNKISGRFQSKIDRDNLYSGSNLIQLTLTRYDLGKTLSCEIFNNAMPQSKTLSATLDVDVSPSLVEIQVQRRTLKEGDLVELLCIAKGAKPPAHITWKNGTTPILEARTKANINEEDSEIVHPDGTYETRSILRFVGTRYETSVPFSCEATNAVLEAKRFAPLDDVIELDVQFAPTVFVYPENITVNESANFLIHCEYFANPSKLTHVQWFLDGKQLDIESEPEKYRNGNIENPSLYVINSTAEDMGEYTCRVANSVDVSNVTNSANVSVQYPPEVAVIIDHETPISEDTRPNVTLICSVTRAHPSTLLRVRWFLKGELLKELPECGETSDDESYYCDITPSRIVLVSVHRQFEGDYSCEGMNEAGWGMRSDPVPLVIHYAPGEARLTYSPAIVIKGQPMNLTCNVSDPGLPEVTNFIWTRNSHWVRNVTSQVWTIDSASLETEANFTCLPYNVEGNGTTASVQIDVLAQPTFITRLPPYHGALMNAEEVSLSCRVECSPLCEIEWLKDNLPLDNNTHYQVLNLKEPPDTASGDMESVVSTLSWKMDRWPRRQLHRELDNANYTCTSSSNRAGMGVSSHTTFRVEYPPENIHISHELLQVVEGEIPDRMNCFASSYPEPSYYWVHNDETVATGTVLDLAFAVERKQSGNYTCVAENKHGIVTSTALLDVLFKPECKISRHDSSTSETSQVMLSCRAYANPTNVSYRWRVGNETLTEMLNFGLESRVYLEGSTASLGTYYCYVNNSVGESIPCEIDVTGIVETLGSDNVLLYILIVTIIIIILIFVVIMILCCLRQRQRGKSPDSSKKGKGKKSDDPNSPADEDPQFYENLPFHGIQAPPNKDELDVTNSPSRPSSQLSHPSSSGYGSSRDQTKPEKKSPGPKHFRRPSGDTSQRNAHRFASMRTPTVKAAKNVLTKTAAYFSLRKSKSRPPHANTQTTDESGLGSTENSLSHDETLSQKDTSFVTSDASHTVSAQRSKNSLIIESTQTSTLTVRPLPDDVQDQSNTHPSINPSNCLGIPILTSSPKRRQPKPCLDQPDSISSAGAPENNPPIAAPRFSSIRSHTHRSLPKKHISFVTPPVENRSKYLYEPKPPYDNCSSSNASTPSSQYQQPYSHSHHSTHTSKSPQFSKYPPSTPPQQSVYSSSRYNCPPSEGHVSDQKYCGLPYQDSAPRNGLPYSRNTSGHSHLHFNGPSIGQEIDV